MGPVRAIRRRSTRPSTGSTPSSAGSRRDTCAVSRPGTHLQPTALVNEVYLRLMHEVGTLQDRPLLRARVSGDATGAGGSRAPQAPVKRGAPLVQQRRRRWAGIAAIGPDGSPDSTAARGADGTGGAGGRDVVQLFWTPPAAGGEPIGRLPAPGGLQPRRGERPLERGRCLGRRAAVAGAADPEPARRHRAPSASPGR